MCGTPGPRQKGAIRRLSGAAALGGLLLLVSGAGLGQVQERFPKPDFQSGYTRPDLITPMPRSPVLEYLDVLVLLAALVLATYFIHRLRSRRHVFVLMVLALAYFGFYRKGCVCSVGSVQNVVYGLFEPGYAIPLTVIAFFVLPLVFSLFFGRMFCAAVCPLGAAQDAVVFKPVKVAPWLAEILGLIPYLYLGLAVLFAATGAGFIICEFDPFVGFFRFGAGFNMVLLGASILLLGTVVARPYCRFLCPYGVLLNWFSRLSARRIKITPSECISCRLCEDSCPFGAIRKPVEPPPSLDREREIRGFALLLLLLPLLTAGTGWVGSRLQVPLARKHFTVRLAEDIIRENAGEQVEMTDPTKAFRASGRPTADLFEEAGRIQDHFLTGGWILGGFVGFIIGLKLLGLSLRRRREDYTADRGTCLACARCYLSCPYEQVRRGLITPEEIEEIEARTQAAAEESGETGRGRTPLSPSSKPDHSEP